MKTIDFLALLETRPMSAREQELSDFILASYFCWRELLSDNIPLARAKGGDELSVSPGKIQVLGIEIHGGNFISIGRLFL